MHKHGRSSRARIFFLGALLGIGSHSVFEAVTAPGDDTAAKIEETKQMLLYYADRSYTEWRTEHPGQVCPPHLHVLYHPHRTPDLDPWGRDFRMRCDTWWDTGEPFLEIRSAGPDRVLGTEDDLSVSDLLGRRDGHQLPPRLQALLK